MKPPASTCGSSKRRRATSARSVSSRSSGPTAAQSVCATTIARVTFSRSCASASAAITPSSTRAPALRRIFASPGTRPSIWSGSIRESMHVKTASPFPARPVKPLNEKCRVYSSFAARTSSNPPTSVRLTGALLLDLLLELLKRLRADDAIRAQAVGALELLDGALRGGAERPVHCPRIEVELLERRLEELHLRAGVVQLQRRRRHLHGDCGRDRRGRGEGRGRGVRRYGRGGAAAEPAERRDERDDDGQSGDCDDRDLCRRERVSSNDYTAAALVPARTTGLVFRHGPDVLFRLRRGVVRLPAAAP